MTNKESMEIIKQLPRRERLEALAEEASELSQAALKVIRAEKLGQNPTPVTADKANVAMVQEFNDVLICALLLGISIPSEEEILNNSKVKRGAARIIKSIKQKENEKVDIC